MDALRCPSGQVSNTPGPVGSCGAYNYISPPKAEAWLTVVSPTTPLGSDDRFVISMEYYSINNFSEILLLRRYEFN